MGEGLRSFFSELKRRKVLQTMAWYAGSAALVIGVVSDGLVNIGLPEWLAATIIWLCIAGFPVTFLLSWFLKVGGETPIPGSHTPRGVPFAGGSPSVSAAVPSNHPTIPRQGIHIQTLGGIRIFRDGEEISSLPRSPVRCALLAYVAVEKNPPKEKALGLLWPEKDPELARKSLNQTLTELRKDLGDDWVDSKGQFLVLREDISTDLGPFQKAVRESDWEQAVAYYEGRFLDGFYLPGAYDFEEWQERIGGSVALSERKANTRLIEAKYKAGDLQGALGLAKGWAGRTPLDDGAQNWFIRLLAETGQRRAALKQAELFLERLKREDDKPLEETVKLIEEIKRGGGGAGEPESPDPEEYLSCSGGITGGESGGGTVIPSHRKLRNRAWSHVLKLGVAGIVIAGIWSLLSFDLHPLDPNTLVCFPLIERGERDIETSDVALGISVALEGTRELRCLDGWQYMSEAARRDPVGLSVREARRIATTQRAAHFLTGTIMAAGDSVFVTLHLHDVRKERELGQNTYRGTLQEATSSQIAARALNPLLPLILDPNRAIDLEYFIERDPAAVATWIKGERFYRNLQFDSAYATLSAAVDQDSLLAAAALRGAQAASWSFHDLQADELAALAARHDTLLPGKQAHLARGLDDFFRGAADDAIAEYQAALTIDPEWNEAWIGMGEVYYHLLPRGMTVPDDAEEAFQRAIALDESFLVPLIHLADIALFRGETSGARRLIGRLVDLGTNRTPILSLQAQADCIDSPLPTSDWEALIGTDRSAAFAAATALSVGVRHPRCAEDGLRALLQAESPGETAGERWAVVVGLSGILLAQGRDADATVILTSALESGVGAVPFLYLMAGIASPDLESLASSVDERGRRAFGQEFERLRPIEGWSLAGWHGSQGNVPELTALSRGLNQIALANPDEGHLAELASAVRGHLALALADTTAAMAEFESLSPEVRYDQLVGIIDETFPFERLRLAEIYLGTGHFREAMKAASQFDHPSPLIFSYFVPESLAIRVRAAQALGFSDYAEACADRLSDLGRSNLINPTQSQPGGAR